jgi:hypothetical protein
VRGHLVEPLAVSEGIVRMGHLVAHKVAIHRAERARGQVDEGPPASRERVGEEEFALGG